MGDILGQNSEAAEECQRYLRMILPALYLDCIFDSFEVFLTAMEKSYLPMVIQIVSIPLHVFWCYLFTQEQQLGITGIAMA
jgi:Na+-driven multidrug efflux pump